MKTRKKALLPSAVPVLLWAGLIAVCQVSVVHADGGLESVPVVINELLASNVDSTADPQGEFDDWIELYNAGDIPVDIGGMYLTDDTDTPMKWQIPPDLSLIHI